MVVLNKGARFAAIGKGLSSAFGVALWIAGCSGARVGSEQEHPTLTFPAHFEPSGDAGVTPPAASADPKHKRVAAGFAPDPPPLYSSDQWELGINYDHGRIRIASVKPRHLDVPQATDRRTGRFAFELWVGHELIERVRFDFPLLASEAPPTSSKRDLHPEPLFGPGADVTRIVLVPANARATRAEIVDRATAKVVEVKWPPEPQPVSSSEPHETPAPK